MSRKGSRGRVDGMNIVGAPAFGAGQATNLPDTLRDMGEHALVAVRRWADPRERELRKRRRARRRSMQLGTVSGLTTVGTVGLVVVSAPAWAVVVVGGGAVALVTGTALSARRYLRLRGKPLPQAAFIARKAPGVRSAARAPIVRLVQAERAMHDLAVQIARSRRLPPDELDDLLDTARSGAAALHALAADIVAMERAAATVGRTNPQAGASLTANAGVSVQRLESGVAEYEQLVAAAGRVLAVPDSSVVAYQFNGIVAELQHAADRLDGWAQALTEIADKQAPAPLPPHGR